MDSAAKETPKEVLMPLGQRALVDTCFEEGHYESGIAVLDKLRSPKYYPSPSHVRQLIYIALYPPPLENAQTPDDLTSGSPKKLNIQRQKTHLLPTPESSVNALSLLCALLHTNSPAALAKGLPSYVTSKGGVRFSGVREEQDDREDAFIGKQSADIRQAKDCWAILADGFVKRSDSEDVAEQPPTEDEMDVDEEEDENTARRVVGKHAWGVLEWLVGLFELDEKVAESKGMPRRSDILLSQIPLARAGLQWDIQSALNVVFDALTPLPLARHDGNGIPSATPPILEQYRTGLGTRLMALLIHLATEAALFSPAPLSPTSLLRLTVPHLSSLPPASFRAFLSSLTPFPSFKLALLCAYLSDAPADPNTTSDRQKPRVLNGRTARVGLAKTSSFGSDVGSSLAPSSSSMVLMNPYPTPSPEKVLPLLSRADTPKSPLPKHAKQAKLHIISALYALPSTPVWDTAIRNRSLHRAIEGLDCAVSETIVEMWEQRLALLDEEDADLCKSDGFM